MLVFSEKYDDCSPSQTSTPISDVHIRQILMSEVDLRGERVNPFKVGIAFRRQILMYVRQILTNVDVRICHRPIHIVPAL